MIKEAKRIEHIEEYYFSKKLKEIALKTKKGASIINLGVGNPDLQPPKLAIKALTEALTHKNAHQYQSYKGIPELRNAFTTFYNNHYGVTIHPETEVIPLMGSKEGIMDISMSFLNNNDQILIPNPGYPTYTAVTRLVNAEPVFYNLLEKTNWLPDIESIKKLDLSKIKLMWLNYPNMPTGSKGSKQVFEQLVTLAKQNNFLLVNDNPYSFILNNSPFSIFNIKGAKNVCLELTSLSKMFNMAGWRIGFVTGSKNHINSILKVKTQTNSGMFYGIQQGAIKALQVSDDWFKQLNTIYTERKHLLLQLIKKLNCSCNKDASGLFVWAKIPKGYNSEAYSDFLLKEYRIFVTPGTVFGSNGEGYVRFSLCVPITKIKDCILRIK